MNVQKYMDERRKGADDWVHEEERRALVDRTSIAGRLDGIRQARSRTT